ncbi:hypothetical protein, partial [Nocardia tengchongensis]|uniref:hypothetical protein n=1 Tax=Nocardia tengchongensis TaxID=2055889 RepID=UPI003681F52D
AIPLAALVLQIPVVAPRPALLARDRVGGPPGARGGPGGGNSPAPPAPPGPLDRSFVYRHRDLLAQIHTAQAAPITGPATRGGAAAVTTASLKADLANAQARISRLAAHNKQLERKLSEFLGEQAWQESGLGAPADIDALQRQITGLEQQVVELVSQLTEHEQELDAARAANREPIANMNKRP